MLLLLQRLSVKPYARALLSEKQLLRRTIRQQIAALSETACRESDAAILHRVLVLPEYQTAETLFAYVSVRKEIGTAAILHHAYSVGKRIALPRICDRNGQMEFALVSDPDMLAEGCFGIPEPDRRCPVVQPDDRSLILVPALCYDRGGMRLGQGGGYYDRWLARTASFSVGLCREVLLQDRVPCAPHDVGVHCVITEKTTLGLPKKPQP